MLYQWDIIGTHGYESILVSDVSFGGRSNYSIPLDV